MQISVNRKVSFNSTPNFVFNRIFFLIGKGSTLRSLLNELARLTVFSTVKRASSFNRDLRVLEGQIKGTYTNLKSILLSIMKGAYLMELEYILN